MSKLDAWKLGSPALGVVAALVVPACGDDTSDPGAFLASRSAGAWAIEPVYEVPLGNARARFTVDGTGRAHVWVTSSRIGASEAYLRRTGDAWEVFPWSFFGDRASTFGIDGAGTAQVFDSDTDRALFHATLACQALLP